MGFGGGRFSPIIAANHQPSPLHGSPVQRLFNQSATQHDSSVSSAPKDSEISDKSQPNESLPRSTSFENVKMDSDQSNREILLEDHKSESMKKESADLLDRMEKNSYSTLPHNSKSLRQLRKRFQDEAGGGKVNEIAIENCQNSSIHNEGYINASKAYSTPNSPMIHMKSTTNSSTSQQNSCLGFGKKLCWLKRSKRAASAPELGLKN